MSGLDEIKWNKIKFNNLRIVYSNFSLNMLNLQIFGKNDVFFRFGL